VCEDIVALMRNEWRVQSCTKRRKRMRESNFVSLGIHSVETEKGGMLRTSYNLPPPALYVVLSEKRPCQSHAWPLLLRRDLPNTIYGH
jgi:hypothetical protein